MRGDGELMGEIVLQLMSDGVAGEAISSCELQGQRRSKDL